jgi:murein DD-endopeptidase MepM/ murein hydrolase activator NlpD
LRGFTRFSLRVFMRSPRYTVLIANRTTGTVRRLTLARRTALAVAAGVATLPLLVGLGISSADPVQLQTLQLTNDSLRMENESYRAATGELADQIASLQSALTKLSGQAEIDPATKAAIASLPAVIKSRAAGGASRADLLAASAAATSPDTTFGVLKNVLGAIENRLASVKSTVESQQLLARATPSGWPVIGWLSSGFGSRRDPFNGGDDFHSGLDIAADKGTAVKATADGTVESAAYNGNYGNSVLLDHGYGIGTRFGHLSSFAVHTGQKVHRGDVIGYVGATGRATSPHLHYEILLNGAPINPLRLLAKP